MAAPAPRRKKILESVQIPIDQKRLQAVTGQAGESLPADGAESAFQGVQVTGQPHQAHGFTVFDERHPHRRK